MRCMGNPSCTSKRVKRYGPENRRLRHGGDLRLLPRQHRQREQAIARRTPSAYGPRYRPDCYPDRPPWAGGASMKIDKTGRVLSDSALENMGGSGRFKAKHGMRNTPEYRTWSDMKNRCLNPRVRSYSNYGGRGITVCKEWVESFEEFFKYVGPRPDGYSLDRIDTDGNYEPGNVRWVTNRSQQNNKRNTFFVMFDGQKISASEYARAVGMKPDTVHARIRRGLKLDGAIICK